jgi:glucose-6-phosphate dehydrogenase assembly protein OpcA
VSGGPGVTAVIFDTSDGEMTLTRPDGRLALLRRPGEPERRVALHRRDTAELLSEELRRLDPDEVYAETIAPFVPAPAQVKPNGGTSRKRAAASADTSRKDKAR